MVGRWWGGGEAEVRRWCGGGAAVVQNEELQGREGGEDGEAGWEGGLLRTAPGSARVDLTRLRRMQRGVRSGCRAGAERVRSACRARAERVQSEC